MSSSKLLENKGNFLKAKNLQTRKNIHLKHKKVHNWIGSVSLKEMQPTTNRTYTESISHSQQKLNNVTFKVIIKTSENLMFLFLEKFYSTPLEASSSFIV